MPIPTPWRQPLYLNDVAILKQYGDDLFKIVQCKSIRNKGIEMDGAYVKKGSVNDEKLSNNITRARSTVTELGLCNPWEQFATLTISANNLDRYDLKAFRKVLSQWIRDYNKRHGCDIKYVLIPEQHKDGAWHAHGFFMGIPPDHLTPFTLSDRLPHYIREKLKRGEAVYNWQAYAKKFGFIDLEPIRNRQAATYYILKYITKDLERSVTEQGAHLYYASQGLRRAREIKRGTMAATIAPDFENDYCKINCFSGQEHSAEELAALIR